VQSGRYSSIFFAKVKLKLVEDPGGEGLDEFGGKPPNPPAFFDVLGVSYPPPPPPQTVTPPLIVRLENVISREPALVGFLQKGRGLFLNRGDMWQQGQLKD